jgi:hypothetical protein
MKVAVLFTVPKTTSADVCWRWRSIDGKTDSTQSFSNYEDCKKDAIANGYLYHHVSNTGGNPPGATFAGRTGAHKR